MVEAIFLIIANSKDDLMEKTVKLDTLCGVPCEVMSFKEISHGVYQVEMPSIPDKNDSLESIVEAIKEYKWPWLASMRLVKDGRSIFLNGEWIRNMHGIAKVQVTASVNGFQLVFRLNDEEYTWMQKLIQAASQQAWPKEEKDFFKKINTVIQKMKPA